MRVCFFYGADGGGGVGVGSSSSLVVYCISAKEVRSVVELVLLSWYSEVRVLNPKLYVLN